MLDVSQDLVSANEAPREHPLAVALFLRRWVRVWAWMALFSSQQRLQCRHKHRVDEGSEGEGYRSASVASSSGFISGTSSSPLSASSMGGV